MPLTLEDLLSAGPLLIIAARPGDECLGAAGFIAASVKAGRPPMVLVITDGTASHPNSRSHPSGKLRRLREAESRAGLAVLGLSAASIGFMGLPDGGSPAAGPAFDATVTAIASLAIRSNAGTILAPWPLAGDPDQEAAHAMASAAGKEAGVRHLSYMVHRPGETPLPCRAPDTAQILGTGYIDEKRAALAEHRSQYADIIIDDPSARQWQNPADATLPPEILLPV